jgi:hypothetical protein
MAKFVINKKVFDTETILYVSEIHPTTPTPTKDYWFFSIYFHIVFLSGHTETVTLSSRQTYKAIEANPDYQLNFLSILSPKLEPIRQNVLTLWNDNPNTKYPILDLDLRK